MGGLEFRNCLKYLPVAAVLLAGCSGSDERSRQASAETSHQAPVEGSRRTPEIFPTAIEVRLFVDTEEQDASDGRTVSRESGLKLSVAQRAEFESLFYVDSAERAFAACYIPHHFFRYYDANGKQIGEIAVCFCCGQTQMEPASGMKLASNEYFDADFGKLEKFVQQLGKPTDIQC